MREENAEHAREAEGAGMAAADPLRGSELEGSLGPHLAPLSAREARQRVEVHFASNNAPICAALVSEERTCPRRRTLGSFSSARDTSEYLAAVRAWITYANACTEQLLMTKDAHFTRLKDELVAQIRERRARDEEVVNWSFVLKVSTHGGGRQRGSPPVHFSERSLSWCWTAVSPRHEFEAA